MANELAILVAEDNAEDAELLQLALERAGFCSKIRFVHDGKQAIDYLEGRGEYADRSKFPFPNIILSDLKMPRLDGFELLKWLRAHPQCSVIPAILMSSSTLIDDISKAYQFGANTFFQKPTAFQDLVTLLTNLKAYWMASRLPRAVGC